MAESTKTKTTTVVVEKAGENDASSSTASNETNQLENDPLVENPYLRMTGYAARIGRLLGTAFSKGVRYTAYTSDVGEAFRPVVDVRFVRAGYAVSWTYVLTDVALQTKTAMDHNRDYVRAGLHAAVFQTFGSMLFPAFIIHTTVHQSEKLFHKMGVKSRWAPVCLEHIYIYYIQLVAYTWQLTFLRFSQIGRIGLGSSPVSTIYL